MADLRVAKEVGIVRSMVVPPAATPVMTFSKVAASMRNESTAKAKPQNVVILRPKEGSTIGTSEEVKEHVVTALMPVMTKVKVRNVRKIRDKGILVETESEQDLQAVKDNVARHVPDIQVGSPRKGDVGVESADEKLVKLRTLRDELNVFLFNDSNKVTRSAIGYILAKWNQTEDFLTDTLADLKVPRAVGPEERVAVPTHVTPAMTFAKVAASRPDPMARVRKLNVVILKPKQGSKIEGVKERVISALMPVMTNIKVWNIRKIRDRGVFVETESEKDLQAMKEGIEEHIKDIQVGDPRKIGPKILIFDVPKDMKETEVLEELYERNVAETGLTWDEFKGRVTFRFRTVPVRSKIGNVVIEVDGQIRKHLLSKDRVYIKFGAHRMKDFDMVTRCFKCLSYGHIAKFCTTTESLCRHCCGAGHNVADCYGL